MNHTYHLPRISYIVAYRVLPHFAFEGVEKAIEIWTQKLKSAGPFYYLLGCKTAEVEPLPADAIQFNATAGSLGDYEYYLMQYPTPPPVNLAELLKKDKASILAPYFSIILRHKASKETHYFVLGQSPTGATTFRSVTADGLNINLGPGPGPRQDLFLGRVWDALNISRY